MRKDAILKRWIKPKYAIDLCLLEPNNYSLLIGKSERESIKKEINNRLKYISFTKHYQHNDGVPRCGLNRLRKSSLLLIVQITGEDFKKETDVYQHKCLYLIKNHRLMVELTKKIQWHYSNILFYGVKEEHPDEYEAFDNGIQSAIGQLKAITEQDINPDTIYTDIVEQSKAINREISKVISCFHQIEKHIGF